MRLICITDLHGDPRALQRILADAGPADALLLGGDLTTFGTPDEAESLVRLAQDHAPLVAAVAGNCDSAAIDRRLGELGVGLHGRGILVGDVGIHGLSAIPPWKRNMYSLTEEQLAAALESGYTGIRSAAQHVLLAHVPPRGMKVDRTHFWTHAGSTAVREFVDRAEPQLAVCGHIHEGRGIEAAGRTTVVNCGLGGHGEYSVAEIDDERVQVNLRKARV
jgi:uncharacterized protein